MLYSVTIDSETREIAAVDPEEAAEWALEEYEDETATRTDPLTPTVVMVDGVEYAVSLDWHPTYTARRRE